MANCPKCGVHLNPLNWSAQCPACGVNIMYFDMDARLSNDADRAEAEAQKYSLWSEKVKAVSIGSALAWVRLLSFLLPVLAMLLPFARGRLLGLGMNEPAEISLITVIKGLISGAGNIGNYLNFSKDGLILLGALLLLLCVVCALGAMIACVFSYGKGGKITMYAFLTAGLLAAAASEGLLVAGGAGMGAGFFLCAACFAGCLIFSKFVGDKLTR